MQNQAEKKKSHLPDIIVISVILLATVLFLIFSFASRRDGAVAVVEINGEVAAEYPLSKDGVFRLNGGTNVLVIEDGAAYLNYSDCPDHTCENTGKIRYVGQTIICLPNRVSITIRGEADNGVDLVS